MRKSLIALVMVVLVSGCAAPPLNVKPRFDCKDWSNAWVRAANDKGILAGTLWYVSDCTGEVGHSVVWALDPNTAKIVFVEPQTQRIIADPSKEPGYREIQTMSGPCYYIIDRAKIESLSNTDTN